MPFYKSIISLVYDFFPTLRASTEDLESEEHLQKNFLIE